MTGDPAPRLAILGAFPWSSAQGSQLLVREQARALERAGAHTTLVSYGRGPLPPPDDLRWRPIARWLSPHDARSGPGWGKPVADAALLAHWIDLARREPFDAVLAHNVEAAAVALAARPIARVPVVYVAHTLMGCELATYGPPRARAGLDAAGALLDRQLARRADAVIALCEDARRALAAHARRPVALLPPGHAVAPPPSPQERLSACARAGVEAGRFALYTGNLDGYQALDRLAAVAERLRERLRERLGEPLGERSVPVVVATHDRSEVGDTLGALGLVRLTGVEEMRALVHAAGVLLLPRRSPGGFPMKLLNYLESGRPVVAHAAGAPGLRDGESARILPDAASPDDWALAVADLLARPEQAQAIGRQGRLHLERHHDWPRIAGRTLELVGTLSGVLGAP
ncbi:MAG: glycosyltransferase family 4 protein [Myxococcota bacterium]